ALARLGGDRRQTAVGRERPGEVDHGRRRAVDARRDRPRDGLAVAAAAPGVRGQRLARGRARGEALGRAVLERHTDLHHPDDGTERAGVRRWIGTGGIEPPASSASRKRSPTELRAYVTPEKAIPVPIPCRPVKA